MKTRLMVSALLVIAAACGKPSDQKAADEAAQTTKQGAKQAQQGADQMAQGIQQMAKGLQQMAQAGADGKGAPLVDFQKLQTVLPTVSGWTRSEPEGHQMTMPFPVSNTEAQYTKGDMEVKITVTDSAFNQLVMTPFLMMTAVGYSEKTSSGYKKATTIDGQPAYEEWDSGDKSGEIGLMVGKRFLVEAHGSHLDSIDTLKGLVQKIDVNKLGGLK